VSPQYVLAPRVPRAARANHCLEPGATTELQSAILSLVLYLLPIVRCVGHVTATVCMSVRRGERVPGHRSSEWQLSQSFWAIDPTVVCVLLGLLTAKTSAHFVR